MAKMGSVREANKKKQTNKKNIAMSIYDKNNYFHRNYQVLSNFLTNPIKTDILNADYPVHASF